MRATVRHLSQGVAIYGAGDAAVQIVNLLLLPVYVRVLSKEDYGSLGVVLAIEMIARIVSRWGLDGAFMRYYHDRPAGGPLERLTSTIVWFIAGADVIVFGVALAASGWIGARFSFQPPHLLALRLMLVNTFLISLTFVPYHSMRLRHEAATYSGLVFARSLGTLLLRIALILWLRWNIAGVFAADVIMTVILLPILWRWFAPLVRGVFSWNELGTVLRFGLPRLPHGLAQAGLDAGNKLLLNRYISREALGVYQNGFTLGTGVRFFTSAFETAWAPFYYATAKQPDGRMVLAKMATYGFAVLSVIVALSVAVSREAVLLFLKPEYLGAVRVIPLIALGMAMQGAYLLASIGLNLTSRTQYYPVATFAALAVGLGSGLVLMPRYGITGAAIAFAASGFTQALVAFGFARHFFPIPFEAGRILRVIASATVAAVAAIWLVPDMHPLVSFSLRALVTVLTFLLLLAGSGFLRKTERAFALEMLGRLRRKRVALNDAGAE